MSTEGKPRFADRSLLANKNMSEINNVDLGFIIDSTGSMGTLIASAKRNMATMVTELSKNANIKMRVSIVSYRDHKPQDSVLTLLHEFSSNLEEIQKSINSLQAAGGGDGPEAVFDGISDAIKKLSWNKHSRRILVLIGDAPPHGVGAGGDGFPKGCPCGDDIKSITALTESNRTTLYSIGLTSDPNMQKSFKDLSTLTGGEFFQADPSKAIKTIEDILKKEFTNIEFDKLVLDLWNKNLPIEDIVTSLNSNRVLVGASLSRLGSRELLTKHETLP